MFENPHFKPIWTILPLQIFGKSGDKKTQNVFWVVMRHFLRISEHCDESSFRLFLPFQLHSRFEAKEEPLSLLSMMSYGSFLLEILPFFLDEQNRFLFMKKLYCKLCISFMKFSIVWYARLVHYKRGIPCTFVKWLTYFLWVKRVCF